MKVTSYEPGGDARVGQLAAGVVANLGTAARRADSSTHHARRLAALLLGAVLLASNVALAQAPPADAKGSAPAPAAPKQAEGASTPAKPAAPSITGGYTWSEKPTARARKRRVIPIDVHAPQASYPGFQMLPDGSSQLSLDVSRFVAVSVKKDAHAVTYHLQGVQVGVRNNTFPLDTRHFRSPLALAQLQRVADGAVLVVRLKPEEAAAGAALVHRVQTRSAGRMRLLISIPAARFARPASEPAEQLDSASAERGHGPLSEQGRGPEL